MVKTSYVPFNEWQQKAMFALPIAPSLLSLVSSFFIIYIIWNDRSKKLQRVYHRIMFGLSCADVINSVFLASSTVPVPRGTPGFFGNVGTTFTCDFQGFVGSGLGLTVPFFNMTLCFYYVLTVVFSISEEIFVRRWEKPLYTVAVLLPLSIATVSVVSGAINPQTTASQCFLTAAPFGCTRDKTIPCTRGGELPSGFFYLVGIIIVSIFVFVIVSTTAVYIVVSRQETRMISRYSFRGSHRRPTQGARQVAIQAVLYQSAFLLSFLFPLMTRQFRRTNFPLSAISQIMYPLQGFSNAFIYVRPRFNILRRQYPELPWWTILFAIPNEVEVSFSSMAVSASARGNRSIRRSRSVLCSQQSSTRATGSGLRGEFLPLSRQGAAASSCGKSSSGTSSGVGGGQLDSMIDDMELNLREPDIRHTPPIEEDSVFMEPSPRQHDDAESESKSVVEVRTALRTSDTTTTPRADTSSSGAGDEDEGSDEEDSVGEKCKSVSVSRSSSRSVPSKHSSGESGVAPDIAHSDDNEEIGVLSSQDEIPDEEFENIYISRLKDVPNRPASGDEEDGRSRQSSESLDIMDLMNAMEEDGDDDIDDMQTGLTAAAQSPPRPRINENSSKYLGCVDVEVDEDSDDDYTDAAIQAANEYRRMTSSQTMFSRRSSSLRRLGRRRFSHS